MTDQQENISTMQLTVRLTVWVEVCQDPEVVNDNGSDSTGEVSRSSWRSGL